MIENVRDYVGSDNHCNLFACWRYRLLIAYTQTQQNWIWCLWCRSLQWWPIVITHTRCGYTNSGHDAITLVCSFLNYAGLSSAPKILRNMQSVQIIIAVADSLFKGWVDYKVPSLHSQWPPWLQCCHTCSVILCWLPTLWETRIS